MLFDCRYGRIIIVQRRTDRRHDQTLTGGPLMIRASFPAFLSFVLLIAGCSPPAENPPAEPAAVPAPAAPAPPVASWTVTEGVAAPESVYADPSGSIFASQIVGMPGDK